MEPQLFTECHYSRFSSGGRTNIYGLALFETSMESGLPVDSEFPSNIIRSFPQNISHKLQNQNKSKAIRHLFVSSFYGITCFASATGYWNTVELPLNQDIGEIISMDTFSSDQSNLVFALTTVHTEGDGQHNFTLRIYSLDDASQMYIEEAIFRIAEQCQVIRIPFTPMQLFHTRININGESNTCLLLCGNDGGVHLYLRNKSTNKWEEEHVRSYFPFLASLSESSILSLEIREIGDLKIVAAGCQNGRLHVSIMKFDTSVGDFVPMDEPACVVLFSPITSISVFSSSSSKVSPGDIHMLVTCAVERAIIYCNVDKLVLNRPVYLKECSQYDSVLCSNIMDVDWDGNNEILVGTYGRELLVYKQDIDHHNVLTFKLIWQRSFSHPIYQIANLDLNQDGIEELIVATQHGIHILQPNLEKAKLELLKVLEDLKSLKNELKELKE